MSEDRDLGLDARITRKDFLNATLLGVGGLLMSAAAPASARGGRWRRTRRDDFDRLRRHRRLRAIERQHEAGPRRRASRARRRLREAAARTRPTPARSTTSSSSAAASPDWRRRTPSRRRRAARKTCLVLENHPIFGGGAKQNEFLVNGVRLVGPQASNQFGVPARGRHVDHERGLDGLRAAALVRVSGRRSRRSAACDPARQLRAHGRRQRDAGGRRLLLRRAQRRVEADVAAQHLAERSGGRAVLAGGSRRSAPLARHERRDDRRVPPAARHDDVRAVSRGRAEAAARGHGVRRADRRPDQRRRAGRRVGVRGVADRHAGRRARALAHRAAAAVVSRAATRPTRGTS